MRPSAPLYLVPALAVLLSACGETQPPIPESVLPPDSDAQQDTSPESFAADDLPPRFNDYVPKVVREYDNPRGYIYHHAEPEAFEMVLVPGDAAAGIEPFYIGRTEVTWDMFQQWAYGGDIDPERYYELMEQDLRPSSWPHVADSLVMGLGQRPATGMSWRTAEAFCLWLSEQTGRTYRLPTDTEWSHVLALSGGVPADEVALLARAALAENSVAEIDAWGWEAETTRYVACGEPDALGLYDLLGNVAEWVQPTDEGRWVRGGHFGLPAAELTADWKAVEDQRVWNATYPQMPVSRYWYNDHYYQGLRLVCEAHNLPEEVGEPLIYPRRFTGEVPYHSLEDEEQAQQRDGYYREHSGIESGLGWPRPTFDMTLIPGDAANGIDPFYMQTTEVTWDMFGNWFAGRGLGDAAFERWRGYGFHPSMYWDSDMVRMGLGDRPAVGMSRRAAELFCAWLSAETGRAYRLPTDAEWRHALAAGGGVPAIWDELLEQAALHNNGRFKSGGIDVLRVTFPVGELEPNALGLHDLLGNAAEWVTGTGDERVVRGGHYLLPAWELSADWRAVEDLSVWNASYPQHHPDDPGVRRDAPFVGFRLVCEVEE